jgi:hypothetical protein
VAIFQCVVVGIFAAIAMADVVHLPLGPWLSGKLTSLTRTLRPFDLPVLLVFAALAVSIFFLFRRQLSTWLLTSSMASLGLLVGALTVALPAVEAESSAKPVALKMMAERQGDEPYITGKFLARGIIYYTNTDMTSKNPGLQILAKKAQPFWAAHPLPVIVGKKGLKAFLQEHPTAICTLRKGEWREYGGEPAFVAQDDFSEFGENVIVRAHAKKAEPPAVSEAHPTP